LIKIADRKLSCGDQSDILIAIASALSMMVLRVKRQLRLKLSSLHTDVNGYQRELNLDSWDGLARGQQPGASS
jgi:hypothetical protein